GPREAPTMKVVAPLHGIDNFFAFLATLERCAPGREYGDDAQDLGSIFRPSASSHDPRYVSGRTRLLIFGGLLGVGAIAGLAVAAHSWWSQSRFEAERDTAQAGLVAKVRELHTVAEAATVSPGVPYACAAEVKEVHDVIFVARAPAGQVH